MTSKEELIKQQRDLEQQLKTLREQEVINDFFDLIKTKGFQGMYAKEDKPFTYEELLEEYNKGAQQFEYKGVTFETLVYLHRSEGSSYKELRRKVTIVKVTDWTLFERYHNLLNEYDFGQNHYYDFPGYVFREIPYYDSRWTEEYHRSNYGEMDESSLVIKWSAGDQCQSRDATKNKLENCVAIIKAQIDLIEKIGSQQTDIRDETLEKYSDYQLEYEMKKRNLVFKGSNKPKPNVEDTHGIQCKGIKA